jgi:hypothetical protein
MRVDMDNEDDFCRHFLKWSGLLTLQLGPLADSKMKSERQLNYTAENRGELT